MEPLQEPARLRTAKINSKILGRDSKDNPIRREALLDALQALYDECATENLQKSDPHVADFVANYTEVITDLKKLRVNLSDFEIKNTVARGHFGDVHLVKEKQTGDIFAMKSIKKFTATTDSTSFSTEKDIMAFGNSGWLTSLHYSFQDTRYLYFIMDYHPGGDLLALLVRQGGTLPESAVVFYLAELVLAINELHSMGYVHRDIKPENVLLDRCGHLKLADFGSAAKLNSYGMVTNGPPIGTPDYVAPEVLQSYETKERSKGYGVSCDYWSLGVIAYELTVGNTPFSGQSTTLVYSKIMDHKNNLQFPNDIVLTQGYVALIKGLVTDAKNRLDYAKIIRHPVFKNIDFDGLHNQVPPYVPKLNSPEDTSNFIDVQPKKKEPTIEGFKKRTQFSGRNLPYIGFTYTPNTDDLGASFDRRRMFNDEIVQKLKTELDTLKLYVSNNTNHIEENESLKLRVEEKDKKLENIESIRDKLERELATTISENNALKRTLELERKERSDLEKKALDLIKVAKSKWESTEKAKVDGLLLEIEQLKEKNLQLDSVNKLLNEQLQHALKSGEKHKESLLKVEQLNRRSVLGLETRLEQVSMETQTHVADLESKLIHELQLRVMLEENLEACKMEETNLREQLACSEENFVQLKFNMDKMENIIRRLNSRVSDLEEELETVDKYKQQLGKCEEELYNFTKLVKQLENKNKILATENETIPAMTKQIDALKQDLCKMQNDNKHVTELENQLIEEKEKFLKMQQQLKDIEDSKCETQELKDLRMKFWRTEKELSNAKIDRRILERELKDAQAEIKQLTETVTKLGQNLEEEKKNHESAILELSNINESLSVDFMKHKENVNSFKTQLNIAKEQSLQDKKCIADLKRLIEEKENTESSLKQEITRLAMTQEKLQLCIKKQEENVSNTTGVMKNLEKDKQSIYNELERYKTDLRNKDLNLQALREACILLEKQIVEYENLCKMLQAKLDSNKENTEKLISDLCKAKEDVQAARKACNEEKSLKLLAETKVKRSQEELTSLQDECAVNKKIASELKQYSMDLTEKLKLSEEKVSNLEISLNAANRSVKECIQENNMLKEENSAYLTQILSLKESNYILNKQISDYKENNKDMLHQNNDLQSTLKERLDYYKERELKADSTIRQQAKLIDYLQTKIDEQSHKKKTLTEKIFGQQRKENQPPASMYNNNKTTESQVKKEKELNNVLKAEIQKLQTQIKNCTCQIQNNLEKHGTGKQEDKNKSQLARQTSLQTHFHRFEMQMLSTACECLACLRQIVAGVRAKICKNCSIIIHSDCTRNLQAGCNPPSKSVGYSAISGDDVVEGWLQLYSEKASWIRTFVRMHNKTLRLFDTGMKQISHFDLSMPDCIGRIVFEPVHSEFKGNIDDSELPNVLKVEISYNNQSTKQLIFKASSLADKEKWYKVFQKAFQSDENFSVQTLVQIPDDISVNCLIDVTGNMKLLGANNGLYCYQDDNLTKITGVDEVHYIRVIPKINSAIMIVNKERIVIYCDLNHIFSLAQCLPCTKPSFIYKTVNVDTFRKFHMLEVSDFVVHQYIAVASSKHLLILSYDLESNEFYPKKVLDTAEPTTCMLFTENSLIVGADKFFEIDLINFSAEEFIDLSDTNLNQIAKCYKIGSSPMSIIEIGRHPKEFLVSFKELSVCVDAFGSSSRNTEWMYTQVPKKLCYSRPYLYIVYYNSIEVIEIDDDFCNLDKTLEELRQRLVKTFSSDIKYVGFNKGVYVISGDKIEFIKAEFDSSLSELNTELNDSSGSSKFSFTSSIVQCLEEETNAAKVEDANKKVKFSERN